MVSMNNLILTNWWWRSENSIKKAQRLEIRANAEKNMQALDRAGGAIKALDALRKQASVSSKRS